MTKIIEKFVKKDFISSGFISSLMNVDIYYTNNNVSNIKIEIGFAVKTCLIKADLRVAIQAEFKHQCVSCYLSICS